MMKKPILTDFKQIAIIQTAFIGDTALTLYLVQAIKVYHPKSIISFISTPQASGIVSCSKAVDNIISFDKKGERKGLNGIKYIARHLRELNIECVISPHRSLRTTLISKFSKPVFSVGFNISAFSFLYSKGINYIKNIHEVERNYLLLSAFEDYNSINTRNIKIELDIHEGDKSFVESTLMFHNVMTDRNLVILAPGSVWATKRWNEEYYSSLAQKLVEKGYGVVLTGSSQDIELCNIISNKTQVLNLAGKTTFPQTFHLLSLASLVITNDSAPTHLAGIAGCPCIVIYGPTSPEFGFSPLGKRDIIIENKELKCKPCHIHGLNKCPVKTHECMVSITPEMVFEKAIMILGGS